MVTIYTTSYNWEARGEAYHEAMASYRDFADEVIEVDDPWPQEFSWGYIGNQFQKGYERANGDWVIRMDLDYILHENDMDRLHVALKQNWDENVLTMWKYQFLKWDRYNLKSRLPNIFNKKKLGDRLTLFGGGDLCQPQIDNQTIDPAKCVESRVPFYNYDWTFATKEQVRADFPRFARAWGRHFGTYDLGGPDEESAFEFFINMQRGRYKARAHKILDIDEHPKYIKDRLRELKPEQFGFDLWNA